MHIASVVCLAIAPVRAGGDKIIHRNQSPRPQANEVDKVKRSLFIRD